MLISSDPSDLLISEAHLLPLAEVLNLPPDRLLGVLAPAQAVLSTLGVRTVFDLAMSRVFNAAVQIEDAADNPSNAMNRFGRPISDLLKPGISGTIAVADLRNETIDILVDIADASAIQAALGVTTVRDLAVYPPFRAAKEILKRVFFPEELETFDPASPSDLVPKSGEFPTERVQYTSLMLDQILRPDNAPPLIDLAGGSFAPIDISPVTDAGFGFSTLGLGMLLTLNQSWFMQGVTLGHLLHSLALGAGESTRVAVIDWSRKTSAGQTESIGETEDVTQDTSRNRSISEVTEAVATEAQSGFSHADSKSTTKQAGGSFGFSLGPFGGGASASISKTSTSANSYATSAGSREVGASMLQKASDRTHQHAHSARTRRASVVREVSQTEHESVSTRVITNYNHMHALTVQYYEVLQVYRTETSITRCDRVVFIPFKLLDFNNTDLLRRFRGALADAALTQAIRNALLNFDTLEFVPERRVVFPDLGGTITDVISSPQILTRSILLARRRDVEPGTETGPEIDDPVVDPPRPPRPPRPPSGDDVADNLWENAASRLSAFFGTPTVRRGSQSLFVPSDVRVEEGAVQSSVRAIKMVFVLRDGTRITDLSRSIALADVDRIALVGSDPAGDVPATGVLALSRNGIVFPMELPTVTVAKGAQETRLIDVRAAGADVNLVQHLNDNRLHYSQAVFRNLDSAMIAGLLSPFSLTLNGQQFPLVQVAEPVPLQIVGNALAFKINTDPVNDVEWRAFMESRGLAIGQAKVDIVPLSSGGIFAEAVLGRFNCAEKLDLSRFFNWQDSPIPILPTEIAAIQTGTRGATENLAPGQFSAPLVSITPPAALPDPAGLAGTLAAIQNGNLFRDMSGLAQTAALAQAALQASAAGATAVGDQAAQNLKTVVENETERQRIAAQVATGGASGAAGSGSATGNRPAKNISEEGARVNHARDMDVRNAAGGAIPSSGSQGGRVVASSAEFGASGNGAQPSIERDIFDRQTGGVAANLANQLANTLGAAAPAGIGGAAGTTPLSHMAFEHILLESQDPGPPVVMVQGVVPATPATLSTPFYNADVAGTIPDPVLQQALTTLINSKPAYKNLGKNLAISLIDLSGANKSAPKYAGLNDLANFYGASVNKIAGLLGVYQLLAEANELLKTNASINDVIGLENEFKAVWTQAGIAAKHHPLVTKILAVQPGSPTTATIHQDLVDRLNQISKGNENGSTPFVLLKFPFIGSTMLAHGLFSPANNGGLWTRVAYGSIRYLGQQQSLPNWPANENPHPQTLVHNINAVSVAQFFTLAAQGRMIDEPTSKSVLRHLNSGGCVAAIDAATKATLLNNGELSAKCGIFADVVHDCVHFKETATPREFVVVVLTKNHTFAIMENLFKDLVALIP